MIVSRAAGEQREAVEHRQGNAAIGQGLARRGPQGSVVDQRPGRTVRLQDLRQGRHKRHMTAACVGRQPDKRVGRHTREGEIIHPQSVCHLLSSCFSAAF